MTAGGSRGSNGGRPWRRLLARVYSEETHCARCGQWVDQTLPDRIHHPDGTWTRNLHAKSGGHIHPYSTHPHLRMDRANVQLEHLGCNIAAGNDRPARPQSRTW